MLKRLISNEWQMKSSHDIDIFGEKISSLNYKAEGWYPVTVPGTVISGLVENEIYPDPYYDKNISKLPGYKHGKDSLFSNHYMPDDSPFRCSWWYRNKFTIPEEWQGKKIWLEFKGINYSANIWLNRKRVAGVGEVQGTYRLYEFDISSQVNYDNKNVLAVEIFAPQPDDLAMTFIDWSPVPPDDSMGIWQPVFLQVSEEISIKNTFVRSKLSKQNQQAELLITAEVYNDAEEEKSVSLVGEIENKTFEKTVIIGAKIKEKVLITVEDCPELQLNNPRIWWPYQMGTPDLYKLNLKVFQGDNMCDEEDVTFGIREINTYLNDKGSRMFIINGQELQLRGAAWTPDLMLRQSTIQDEIDISYIKNMNFNTVRLEGKLATDNFWEICDREGIIVIAGWPCCNHWEKWDKWKVEDLGIAVKSLSSQIKRLRNHPSMTAWFYGSDFPPTYEVEREYLKVMEETHPDIPAISSAADKSTKITGEPGVKMSGPYSYVPPQYWYDKEMPGVAGKFNTETGPDMCIPQMESLEMMLSAEELEVESDAWKLHAGLAAFTDTSVLDKVVEGRFGNNLSIKEYVKAAQLIAYQSWRAMYEAHFRNWPDATGVIGWMLNSSWPSLIWQLYDYYNLPNGAFYGSKKACEPIHLQYSYDDNSIHLANQTFEKQNGMNVRVVLYSKNLEEKFKKEMKIKKLDKYNSQYLFKIPEEYLDNKLSFLFLYLENEGSLISKNVYYLPSGNDLYDDPKSAWFHRPLKQFASLKELGNLPMANLEMKHSINISENKWDLNVQVENNSESIACFNQIKVYDRENNIITPVYWTDNFITLLPGESEQVHGTINECDIISLDDIQIAIEGWNLA